MSGYARTPRAQRTESFFFFFFFSFGLLGLGGNTGRSLSATPLWVLTGVVYDAVEVTDAWLLCENSCGSRTACKIRRKTFRYGPYMLKLTRNRLLRRVWEQSSAFERRL